MKAKTGAMVSITLPVDDGAIARAFADLKEKMARLMAAITQAGTALPRATERSASCATVVAEDPDAKTGPMTSTWDEQRRDEGTAARLDLLIERAARIEIPDATPVARANTDLVESAPPAETPGEAALRVAAEQPRVVDAPEVLAREEDEALLASLDAETASVIRLQSRLTGGRKRVRELLEAYRASPRAGKSADEPRRKSWWKGTR